MLQRNVNSSNSCVLNLVQYSIDLNNSGIIYKIYIYIIIIYIYIYIYYIYIYYSRNSKLAYFISFINTTKFVSYGRLCLPHSSRC